MRTLLRPTLPSRAFAPHAVRGITLLEVLVSVVLMSVGLLGLGAMLSVTLRESQENMKREHGVLVAQSMAELMSANLPGVLQNAYEGQFLPASGVGPSTCSTACDALQKAASDRAYLVATLSTLGESSAASVHCSSGISPVVCDIQVSWRDLSLPDANTLQSVDWRFVP